MTEACAASAAAMPAGRILEHQAVARIDAEPLCAKPEAVGGRLATGNVFRRNDDRGDRNAGSLHACKRQRTWRRGDDGPAFARQRLEKRHGAGDRDNAIQIGGLGLQQQVGLVRRVDAWKGKVGDGLDRPHAVDRRQEGRNVETVPACPIAPHPLRRGDGIDQGAVHVEKEGGEFSASKHDFP